MGIVSMDKWGPPKWKEIHIASLGRNHVKFYNALQRIEKTIPCPRCQVHFRQYMKMHPIRPGTDTVKWAINFHNNVNERIGKRSLSYTEGLKQVYKWKTQEKTWKSVVVGLVTGIITWNLI